MGYVTCIMWDISSLSSAVCCWHVVATAVIVWLSRFQSIANPPERCSITNPSERYFASLANVILDDFQRDGMSLCVSRWCAYWEELSSIFCTSINYCSYVLCTAFSVLNRQYTVDIHLISEGHMQETSFTWYSGHSYHPIGITEQW